MRHQQLNSDCRLMLVISAELRGAGVYVGENPPAPNTLSPTDGPFGLDGYSCAHFEPTLEALLSRLPASLGALHRLLSLGDVELRFRLEARGLGAVSVGR
jgi:hypothetical protein